MSPAMTRPDIQNPETRAAYVREFRMIAPMEKRSGMALILVGVGAWVWVRFFEGPPIIDGFRTVHLCWTVIALGIALWSYAIMLRMRHHRQRMAERA